MTKYRETLLKGEIATQNDNGDDQEAAVKEKKKSGKKRPRASAVQITHLFHHIIWRDVIGFVAEFSLFPDELTCDDGVLKELSYVLKNLHASQDESLVYFRAAREVLGNYLPWVKDEDFLRRGNVICIVFLYYSAMLVQWAKSDKELLNHKLKQSKFGKRANPRGGYVRCDGVDMTSFGDFEISNLVPSLCQIGRTLFGRSSMVDSGSTRLETLQAGLDFRVIAVNNTANAEQIHPTKLHKWAEFAIGLLEKVASEVDHILSQFLEDSKIQMDLCNVQVKISGNSYRRLADFRLDVHRVFENAAIDTNLPSTVKPSVEDVLSLFDQACKERSLDCFGGGVVDSSDEEGSSSDFGGGTGGADINYDSDQGGMDQDGDNMDQGKRTTNFSDGTLGRVVQRHIEDDERKEEITAKAMTKMYGQGADDVKQFVYEASDNESEAKSHPFILDQAEEAESVSSEAMAIEFMDDGGGKDDETGDTREEDELTEYVLRNVVDELGADILLEMKHSSQNSKVVDLFDGSDDEGEDSSASEVSAIL